MSVSWVFTPGPLGARLSPMVGQAWFALLACPPAHRGPLTLRISKDPGSNVRDSSSRSDEEALVVASCSSERLMLGGSTPSMTYPQIEALALQKEHEGPRVSRQSWQKASAIQSPTAAAGTKTITYKHCNILQLMMCWLMHHIEGCSAKSCSLVNAQDCLLKHGLRHRQQCHHSCCVVGLCVTPHLRRQSYQ